MTPEFALRSQFFSGSDGFRALVAEQVVETVLQADQVAGLVAGRVADGAVGHLVEVTRTPVLVGQRLTSDGQDDLVKRIPGLGAIGLHEVQQDGAH